MKSILFNVILTVVFILVTFFGLGPVIYADGPMGERMLTLAIVLLIYAVLVWITIRHIKRKV